MNERLVVRTDSPTHCREMARLAEQWGDAWFFADGWRLSVADRLIPELHDLLILRVRGLQAKEIYERVRLELGFGHEKARRR